MAKKQFKAESKKLLDMMINSIYTHKEIFLREIISNASDAIDKLCYQSLTDENVGMARGDFKIRVIPDKEARTITVSDNGIGMLGDMDHHLTVSLVIDHKTLRIEAICKMRSDHRQYTVIRLDHRQKYRWLYRDFLETQYFPKPCRLIADTPLQREDCFDTRYLHRIRYPSANGKTICNKLIHQIGLLRIIRRQRIHNILICISANAALHLI